MIKGRTIVCVPIALLLVLAVVSIMLQSAPAVSNISFSKTYNADDILSDPTVKHILASSLFTDVRTDISHSEERHPGDQALKDKCLNGGGNPVMGMFNPDTKHCIEIIETADGNGVKKWLVRVVKQVDGMYQEITAFTDEWASLSQVEQYLVNGGYMYLWP